MHPIPKILTRCLALAALSASFLVASARAEFDLGFRSFCCDKTTEVGADEVYFLVFGERRDGQTYAERCPLDRPGHEFGHWSMNDGGQGTKPAAGHYEGAAHCLNEGRLIALDRALGENESVTFLVLVMEEDGGAKKRFQEVAASALKTSGDLFTMSGGTALDLLAKQGLKARPADSCIGSFTVRAIRHGGRLEVQWKEADSATVSQPDPEDRNAANKREFRFHGAKAKYVGWFHLDR